MLELRAEEVHVLLTGRVLEPVAELVPEGLEGVSGGALGGEMVCEALVYQDGTISG